MIWNETIECMDREEMRKLQSLRLKRVVELEANLHLLPVI